MNQATYYHAATPATTYLRCELPARYLPGRCVGRVASRDTGDRIVFPEHEGTAVFQLAADKLRALIATHMRLQGIRVLVETDDNYCTVAPKDIRKRSQWGKRIGESDHTLQGHRSIVRDADGVIVTTEYLAKQYRRVNPNVFVCPNTVDPADWPDPEPRDDGVLRVVWVASKSHQQDIPLVTRAMEWAARQPNVEVWTVGLNPGWRFPRSQVLWIEDLADYRACFQRFDIGLAPVKATPFGLGRSDVKFLEYAMGGVASIVSDVAPYETVPDDVCVKAADGKGFLATVKHLVRHPDEAKQLAEAAREYVLRERTTRAQIHHWQAAVGGDN